MSFLGNRSLGYKIAKHCRDKYCEAPVKHKLKRCEKRKVLQESEIQVVYGGKNNDSKSYQ